MDQMTPLVAGDLAGARAAGRRRIAALRLEPEPRLMLLAEHLAMLARNSELDGDCNEALRHYAEAEALYRRPIAELAITDGATDPAGVAVGIVDSLVGQGACYLKLGQPARAVELLRTAEADAVRGGAATAADLPSTRRWLGQALSADGKHAEAIAFLTPIVDGFPATAPKPFARGLAGFALAQSLWFAGGERDRARARVLVEDAERDFQAALADGQDPAQPYLRTLVPMAREQLALLATWRAEHLAPR
jgi:tetratricopeptide (TPR) repeat protein